MSPPQRVFMYNFFIASGLSALVFGVVAATFSWLTAILPALLVMGLVMFVLARRTAAEVQAALAPIPALAEKREMGKIRALIRETSDTYKNWQFFLERQLNGQLGMLDYMELKFDEALPKLEGSFRDWSSTVAAACVHVRRERFDDAWRLFEDAASYAPKEAAVYQMWATLRARKGDRSEALQVLSTGIEAMGGHEGLKAMKKRVANKQKIDTDAFQMVWFQFFPEHALQRMTMRGARGNPMANLPPGAVRQQMGPPQPKSRGKLARRR